MQMPIKHGTNKNTMHTELESRMVIHCDCYRSASTVGRARRAAMLGKPQETAVVSAKKGSENTQAKGSTFAKNGSETTSQRQCLCKTWRSWPRLGRPPPSSAGASRRAQRCNKKTSKKHPRLAMSRREIENSRRRRRFNEHRLRGYKLARKTRRCFFVTGLRGWSAAVIRRFFCTQPTRSDQTRPRALKNLCDARAHAGNRDTEHR